MPSDRWAVVAHAFNPSTWEAEAEAGLNYTDFMYRIPMGIAAFFISWLIVKILRMIPIVKHIVP